jgi:beta-lactamase class A
MNESNHQTNTPPVRGNFFLSAVLFAFALGVFVGGGFISMITPGKTETPVSVVRDENFRFIRIAASFKESDERRPSRELPPFRYKIKTLIDEKIKKNEVKAASVYFRDLNNGSWFGIGEKERFSPKNILKLPLMIAYFKWAESSPKVLRKKLFYSPSPGPAGEENARAETGLVPGRQNSVNDLIFRMIIEDDNQAYSVLFADIPRERLDKVFKDLNVEYDPHNDDDSLSLTAFASFYRVLFNAAYLNEEMSEKALRYLARSSLKHGIASGIPAGVDVAGKFGQRRVKTAVDGKEFELEQMHEFAIVYHPSRPFLIGIMVRGDDESLLTKTFHDITKLVYEEVDLQS